MYFTLMLLWDMSVFITVEFYVWDVLCVAHRPEHGPGKTACVPGCGVIDGGLRCGVYF